MNDCPNADVRDLLPDLIHGRLDSSARAMVESHLRTCADCRAELALLRDLHGSLSRTPAIDVAAITAAVPSYRAPARRSWVGWRAAAAITLVAAGGSSLLVMQRTATPRNDSVRVAVAPVAPTAPTVTLPRESAAVAAPPVHESLPAPVLRTPPAAVAPPVPEAPAQAASRELAMGGGSLTDLSDRELTSLLKEIESLDAVPSTDVESTPLSPIAPRRGTP